MFRHSVKRFFTSIFIGLFVAIPFQLVANQEDYETRLARLRKEAQPFVVYIQIKTPKREGADITRFASGVVIFKQESQLEDANNEVIKYYTYYILTNAHIVSDEEWDLRDYRKNHVRISVFGKSTKVPAQIVAWEWRTDALLLRVDILEKELEDFKFQVAKFAKELPESLVGSKYSGKDVPNVYLAGYPDGMPIFTCGDIRQYRYNYRYYYNYQEYTFLAKVAFVNVVGRNGPGQSGGPVFNQNLEIIGTVFGGPSSGGLNSAVIIPIDVIIERFLKHLPELKGLDLPGFQLENWAKNSPVAIGRPENVKIY